MHSWTDRVFPGGSRILVVDNDPDIRAQLSSVLQQEGYLVATAADGQAGLRALFNHHPQLVILALLLPGLDGWTLLERIREVTDIPVLILSRQRAVGHRLRAFHLHAQDYITKPFHIQEVVLRVKAALQHNASRQPTTHTVYDDDVLRVDGWSREVLVNGQRLPVTPRELRLLLLLVRQPGRLVPYSELLDNLPWLAGESREAALRSLVHRLRRKLRTAAPDSNYILTQRNLGVRLNVAQVVGVTGMNL